MKKLINILIISFCLTSCQLQNEIEVDFGELNPKDFKIILCFDKDSLNEGAIILQNGVFYDIPNEYGPQKWWIIYKDKEICEQPHLKLNRRKKHKYSFKFDIIHDTLISTLDISGKYKTVINSRFHPILTAR